MPDPQPSGEVESNEVVARHCIRASEHMRRGDPARQERPRGKYPLFLPFPRTELSVVRVSGLATSEIRAIGVDHVCPDVKGHACVMATAVLDCLGLSFDANGEPYPRHANVIGWSGIEPKDRLHAKKLADASELVEY